MNVLDVLKGIWEASGFAALTWKQAFMIGVSFLFIYLAIGKKFEPLLLLPIAFGMLLANLPDAGLMADPAGLMTELPEGVAAAHWYEDGVLRLIYAGVKSSIFPCLIFLCIGAMTDFGPLLANPISLLLGAAAQLGIYVAFIIALLLGFTPQEAAAISIIGGADGPTAIYSAMQLADHLLAPIALAAYSYMALVPVIFPPIIRLFTTKKERLIKMEQLREVSKTEKIMFPIVVTLAVCLIVPSATPLIGCLMLGNLIKECGVVPNLLNTVANALLYICTILLGLSVGATANGETFLKLQTIYVFVLGIAAFVIAAISGILFGKIMCKFSKGKINPMIGAAGVSAVP
ncbi:MAG: sodium ion-translocating decarboxylase subunit beta, partial [Oscillospiraceae bacterium]|nr:sodium ion-translocating decarboxylase subunit beta [Oscillospiraceae bacterium]